MSEEEELKALITKRGQIKGKLTRFKTFLEKFNVEQEDSIEIQSRLAQIEPLYDEFDDVQSQIEILKRTENSEEERNTFESSFFKTKAAAERIILKYAQKHAKHLVPSTICSTNAAPPVAISDSQIAISSKLPILHLPTFSGAYDEWINFYETFHSLIDYHTNLTDIHKFHYLLSCLKDEAADVIKSVEISSANYQIAWDLLKSRFENKTIIVHNHVKALVNLPHIPKESHTALRNLLDNVLKHVRALKILGQPTEYWDTLLIYLISIKLDPITNREWESTKGRNVLPTFTEFTEFVSDRCQILETININRSSQKQNYSFSINKPSYGHKHVITSYNTQTFSCKFCHYNHQLYQCEAFLGLPVTTRITEIKKRRLCINCFRTGHPVERCTARKCRKCNQKHNTLLHLQQLNIQQTINSTQNDQPTEHAQNTTTTETTILQATTSVISHSSHKMYQPNILLSTALVYLYDQLGELQECRVLLDSGSQSNFITTSMCQRLQLNLQHINLPVVGINQIITNIKHKVQVKLRSKYNAFTTTLACLVMDKITEKLPTVPLSITDIKVPERISLADPNFFEQSNVDMLIGAGLFWQLLCVGQIKLGKHQPVLQKTHLGWIVSGTFTPICHYNKSSNISTHHLTANLQLQDQLTKFWQMEECQGVPRFSKEELDCERHFVENVKRDSNGRFIVSLPFKENLQNLGDSKVSAQRRFFSLEKRLQEQPSLREQYVQFIEDYETLNHMQLVPPNHDGQLEYYLPHHAVLKEFSTTAKVRVVFDGSAKSSTGVSLNDTLMVGPTIQDQLFSIVLRFRQHNYVITANVTKMYRHIQVREEDQNMQKILWRKSPNEPLLIYNLITVTYGTASAPFLATRCLKELALQESNKFPEAAKVTLNDSYVGDVLTGSSTIEQTLQIRDELISLFRSGGFELSKWTSNDPKLLNGITDITNKATVTFDQQQKTLGLLWRPNSDTFEFSIHQEKTAIKITKRSILSNISKIFDPLGLIGPIIVKTKMLIQKLWQLKLGWDDSVPLDIHTSWLQLQNELHALIELRIHRHVLYTTPTHVQLHGFSDASEAAYGACIYIRSSNNLGEHTAILLCAKSRVSPLKSLSILRLELCGALLLARLSNKVRMALNITINDSYYWCDSTIVLAWIATPPNQLKTFVSTRVSEIQSTTQYEQWKHVSNNENPAYLISRGVNPRQLMDANLWWNGPKWLSSDQSLWPSQENLRIHIELPETKQTRTVIVVTTNIFSQHLFSQFSSLLKLQRVIAYCLRFKVNSLFPNSATGNLSSQDLQNATNCLIRLAQADDFHPEIKSLKDSGSVSRKSKLLTLNPFVDSDGIIRMCGRIKNAPISYSQMHPIVLPSKHKLTKLIIQNVHKNLLHAGPQLVLSEIRQKYWPMSARSIVRNELRKCMTCFQTNLLPITPLMSNLPKDILAPSRPFTACGVDYAGPFKIRDGVTRIAKTVKVYLCIFVCFATKAVHCELVSSLTTQAFIAALKRFISIRGKCARIYSDNATNFVGANTELSNLHSFFSNKQHQEKIANFLSKDSIEWLFIPSRPPYFGGLWEAAVKLAKLHVNRVLSDTTFTFEELYTVFIQIETCLNSRPLTPLSNDPDDFQVLTPGHFLLGDSFLAPPQENLRDIPTNRLSRFQQQQQVVQHFWTRWSKEYLSNLQQHRKWNQNIAQHPQLGQLVVVRDDNLPPMTWQLGRITAINAGTDGITRVVSVKTVNGEITRAITRVCALPVYEISNND